MFNALQNTSPFSLLAYLRQEALELTAAFRCPCSENRAFAYCMIDSETDVELKGSSFIVG